MYSSKSMKKANVHQPPIAKSTSEILRNVLLSTDRIRFNKSTENTSYDVNNNNYHSVLVNYL